jgi:hypothetical protein
MCLILRKKYIAHGGNDSHRDSDYENVGLGVPASSDESLSRRKRRQREGDWDTSSTASSSHSTGEFSKHAENT